MGSEVDAAVAAFALHNVEEFVGLDELTVPERLAEWYRPERFALAVVLLTVAVAAVWGAAAWRPTNRTTALGLLACGAIGVNALLHIGRAVVTLSWNPGLITAVVAVTPAVALLTVGLRRARSGVRPSVAPLLVAGAVLSVPAIVVALLIATAVLP